MSSSSFRTPTSASTSAAMAERGDVATAATAATAHPAAAAALMPVSVLPTARTIAARLAEAEAQVELGSGFRGPVPASEQALSRELDRLHHLRDQALLRDTERRQ